MSCGLIVRPPFHGKMVVAPIRKNGDLRNQVTWNSVNRVKDLIGETGTVTHTSPFPTPLSSGSRK